MIELDLRNPVFSFFSNKARAKSTPGSQELQQATLQMPSDM